MEENYCDNCGYVFMTQDDKFIEYPNEMRTILCWDCYHDYMDDYTHCSGEDDTIDMKEIDDYIEECFRTGKM